MYNSLRLERRMRVKKITILVVVIMIFTLMFDVAEAATLGDRTLMFRARGSDVMQLQRKLVDLGYWLSNIDGAYGQLTERAVINFQRDNRLSIDGIAGFETISRLKQLSLTEYIVQSGDTLSRIANSFGTTISQLRRDNNLYSDFIMAGQRLRVPASANTSVTTNNNFIINVTPKEMEYLKRAVYSEARGEPYKGQVAVAAVILNRVRDPRFPDSITEVIFEPWAFTALHDGQFWLEPDPEIISPIKDALKGWDPSGGAVFYYNPVTATSYWIFSRQVIDVIGRHYFAI